MWLRVSLLALGGALGTVLRWLSQEGMLRLAGNSFPVGTLLVNVVGCFAIGLLESLFLGQFPIREEYRLAIIAGLLGGFTTFSSYGWDTLALFNQGGWSRALVNIACNNGFGLLAALAGYRLAQARFGA
jgi:CrcB protein